MTIKKSSSRHVCSVGNALATVVDLSARLSVAGVVCLLLFGASTAAISFTKDESSLQTNSNRRLVESKVFVRHSLQSQDEHHEYTDQNQRNGQKENRQKLESQQLEVNQEKQKRQEAGRKRDERVSQQARLQLEGKKDETTTGTEQSQNLEEKEESETAEPDSEEEQLESQQQQSEEHRRKGENDKEEEGEEHFEFPEAYVLGPTIKDWDKQRKEWLQDNPHMKLTPEGKPRVLMMTGSSPTQCLSAAGDNFYVRSFKSKLDYARIHKYEIFYNFALWDPVLTGQWVKLPLLRNMMLTHPEIEWFFWVDSDAIFTDILYEAPLESFDGYNIVMEGWMGMLLEKQSWLAANDGVILVRNCQWTLDLIDKWTPMGPNGPVRTAYGKIFTKFFTDRWETPADDQSALAYLMITDESIRSKVKLLENVHMSGYWKDHVDTYERLVEQYHPGLGDDRWPWVTHFTGCGLCGREASDPFMQRCLADFYRAFNFADNQVLAYWGFQHDSLDDPSLHVSRIRNETDRPVDYVDVNPWAERIAKVAAG